MLNSKIKQTLQIVMQTKIVKRNKENKNAPVLWVLPGEMQGLLNYCVLSVPTCILCTGGFWPRIA